LAQVQPAGEQARAPVVVAEPPSTAALQRRHVTLGHVVAARRGDVVANVDGIVTEILLSGQEAVPANAAVARLRNSAIELALSQARMALATAEIAAERLRDLSARGAATRVQAETAEAELDAARAVFDQALEHASRLTLRTPVAGRIGLIALAPGDRLTAGDVVAEVVDTSELWAEFGLSEAVLDLLDPSTVVTVRPALADGLARRARVLGHDPAVDPATGLLRVRAAIAAGDGALWPGMRIAVDLLREGAQFPAVDPSVLHSGRRGPYIWVLRDGQALDMDVRVRARQDRMVLIEADLAPGDLVVLEGAPRLRRGLAATARPPAREETATASSLVLRVTP
jgi:RND family efflux transporter MFP subunit